MKCYYCGKPADKDRKCTSCQKRFGGTVKTYDPKHVQIKVGGIILSPAGLGPGDAAYHETPIFPEVYFVLAAVVGVTHVEVRRACTVGWLEIWVEWSGGYLTERLIGDELRACLSRLGWKSQGMHGFTDYAFLQGRPGPDHRPVADGGDSYKTGWQRTP